ncbi:MAG: biopolymer transporter ExbD [Candidatus Brocadiae bacterium]|nr:biopolymer transporter ExbD [Candidatus Brocadiia bacterium]
MRPNTKELAQIQIDMTPMIDVVFNLLIFFMLVNQMVQVERAELQLPLADQAKEEKMADQKELILNVHKDGRVEVSGRFMNWVELARLLFEESKNSRDSQDNSNRSVLIRGDIDAPYKVIQKVMVECAKQKIYKISFAARIPAGN